jgi:predicted DCC family thiol-disulfide oxidoreductase YuxK
MLRLLNEGTCLNTANLPRLTLFFDGQCPLCQAEIVFLSRRNQAGLLAFIDINSDLYDERAVGVSCSQALAEMYGQFDNGLVIKGHAVFGEAYRRAGLPRLAWVMSRKTLAPLLAVGYRLFAKHRHRISKLIGPMALWLVGGRGAK